MATFEGKYYGKSKFTKVNKAGKVIIEEYTVHVNITQTDFRTFFANIDFNCNKKIDTLMFISNGKLTGIGSGNTINVFEFIGDDLVHNISQCYNGDYFAGAYKLNRVR